MANNFKLADAYFCGNEISAYGQEHGFLDYATFAKAFDAVLNNNIFDMTWNIGNGWELVNGSEFDEETEKKGLGTPATRASIIEKLVSSGYAVRKGKQLCGVSYAGGGRWQGCFPSGVPEEEKIKTFPQRLREGQV